RSIPRAAVFSRPSVTSRERGFMSGPVMGASVFGGTRGGLDRFGGRDRLAGAEPGTDVTALTSRKGGHDDAPHRHRTADTRGGRYAGTAPPGPEGGPGEHHRHHDRVVRLLPLRNRSGPGLPGRLLPGLLALRRAAGVVRDVLRGLRRPPHRRRALRALG